MNKHPLIIQLVSLLVVVAPTAQAIDLQYAASVREKIAGSDPQYQPALNRLISEADQALSAGPFTVTDKKVLAPSNDPRDYVSLAPYYWPDPAKPDGLPFKNHDGEVWPQARNPDYSDHDRLEHMFATVSTLNLAAYFTGKPSYARRSAQLLRIFFLDPKTGMNPNLRFAQAVRGQSAGRSFGIIEFSPSADFLDTVRLMEQVTGEDIWTRDDRQAFRKWCGDLLDWLSTSENGRQEANAANNHGDWFDATAIGLADYLGDSKRVVALAKSTQLRIGKQVRGDGSLPLEMKRTRSWHYCLYALNAFATTSERARRAQIDLWHWKPSDTDAGDLNSALAHLLHYTETADPWPKQDIDQPEDPLPLYFKIRSLLDPVRDQDLCRRLDAVLATHSRQLRDTRSLLTIGLPP